MNKLKILCVIDDLTAGGAQRQLVNLALGLKDIGHDISFLTYHERTFYVEILTKAGISIHLIDEKNPLLRLLKFRKFIRSNQFTSVISFLGVPSFLASFAAFPIKKFKLIVGERSSNPEIKRSLKSKLIRIFYGSTNYIVANSHSNIDLVKSILPFISENKFKVIYNGIDLNKYKSDSDFIFKSNNKFKLMIPASYRKLKNLLGLIEAVNLLDSSTRNSLLIQWYGDKTEDANHDSILNEAIQLINKYHLNEVFQLNAATHEIPQIMKSCDAVGLFSYFEGLPNAICEGMASSKPIIATAVSDVPILIEDGINGFVCDAKKSDSIAMALEKLVSLNAHDLKKMGDQNRIKAEKLFDQFEITKAYETLLMKN